VNVVRQWKEESKMPIGAHLILMMVCQFAGCFAVGSALMNRAMRTQGGIGSVLLAVGAAMATFCILQLLFTFVIPARCPNCGGRAFCRGGRPITYICSKCSHVHTTELGLGS